MHTKRIKPGLRVSLCVLIFSLVTIYALGQDQTVTLANGKKVVLHANGTWEYVGEILYDFDFSKLENNKVPDFLRSGVNANKQTLIIACEMYLQGWSYTMPRPKSSQARWGNNDGRTTWWKGHWYNEKTKRYSRSSPKKDSGGYYLGDQQNEKGSWRNGGSPSYPSAIEWLLSSSGGVKPVK